jgi:hypothetical protein
MHTLAVRLAPLALRRLAAQPLMTASMVATMAFTGGVLVAVPIYAAGAHQAIVFGYMARTSPLDKDLLISLLTPPGFDLQHTTARIRSLLAPLPISRTVIQEASAILNASGPLGSAPVRIAYRDGGLRDVFLVEGRAPANADDVLVPESVAETLGARAGSRISLRYARGGTVTVIVSGLYSSLEHGDPLVYAEGRLLAPPAATAEAGLPLITTSGGFASITSSMGDRSGLRLEWDAEPGFSGMTTDSLRQLADAERRIASRILTTGTATEVTTHLNSLISGAERAVSEGLAPTYLVASEVALVGLWVLIGIAAVRLGAQSFELAVLKTRGARARELLALQAAESVLSGVPAVGLSIAIGLGLAAVARGAHGPGLPGAPFPIALSRLAIATGLIGITVGVVAIVAMSVPRVRRNVIEERRQASRQPGPGWLRLPYEALPLVAGLLMVAELRRRGIGSSAEGLDPLVLLAPALLLLGGGMLAVRLLLLFLRRAERLSDRMGSPSAFLALRRLPRSTANVSLILLLVLSMGLFSFSSSLRTTVLTRNQDVARQQVGADWSLFVGTPTQGLVAATRLRDHETMAFFGSASYASDSDLSEATVIGIDPASYASGAWWQPKDASLPLAALLSKVEPPLLGLAIPHGTTAVEVRVVVPEPRSLRLSLTLQGADGAARTRDLEPIHPGDSTYRTSVSDATRLLSIVILPSPEAIPSLMRAGSLDLSFHELRLIGPLGSQAIDLSRWRGLETGGAQVLTSPIGSDAIRTRLMVIQGGPVGGIAPPAAPIPALVGGVSGDEIPDSVTLRVGYLRAPIHIVGTLRALPGTDSQRPFVVVPVAGLIERFEQIQRGPNGGAFAILAMGTGDPTQDVRRAGFQIVGMSRAATIEAELASRQQNLAIGMEFAAAMAGVLLGVLALALTLYFGARRFEYEFSSVRALGGRLRSAAAALAIEYGILLGVSTLVGCAGGVAILAMVLSLVAPRVGASPPPALLLDWNAIGAAATAAGTVLLAALLLTARQIGRSSATAVLRGEPQ